MTPGQLIDSVALIVNRQIDLNKIDDLTKAEFAISRCLTVKKMFHTGHKAVYESHETGDNMIPTLNKEEYQAFMKDFFGDNIPPTIPLSQEEYQAIMQAPLTNDVKEVW